MFLVKPSISSCIDCCCSVVPIPEISSHGEGLASNPPPISIIFIHISHFLLLFLRFDYGDTLPYNCGYVKTAAVMAVVKQPSYKTKSPALVAELPRITIQ